VHSLSNGVAKTGSPDCGVEAFSIDCDDGLSVWSARARMIQAFANREDHALLYHARRLCYHRLHVTTVKAQVLGYGSERDVG
jgi:hypothetical protein